MNLTEESQQDPNQAHPPTLRIPDRAWVTLIPDDQNGERRGGYVAGGGYRRDGKDLIPYLLVELEHECLPLELARNLHTRILVVHPDNVDYDTRRMPE